MKKLSKHIELGLESIIEGLNRHIDVEGLDDDKVKSSMESKISSFQNAKRLLSRWVNSENAPSKEKIQYYVKQLVGSGDQAIENLQEALSKKIDYDELDESKYKNAMDAKPLVLDAIFELDASMLELRIQLETDTIVLEAKEFKIGYPERYAKQEFFPLDNYHKKWLGKDGSVNICPHTTKGKIITLENLNIQLPKPPKDKSKILFSDLPKKDQHWRRVKPKREITIENQDAFASHILEEFRRRREGVWFMNNGEATYLTGTHYFSLQHCKMLDTGGYMDFRYAQLNIYYFMKACEVDERCLGMCFVKSRRTGFTYIALSDLLDVATSKKNGLIGVTSKTDLDAEYAFGKFSYMFLNLPFYFRPVVRGREDSQKVLDFAKPSNNSKVAKKSRDTSTVDYLNTKIDYQPSKIDSYDGQKLDRWLGDEYGKLKSPNDAIKHLGTITPTMMPAGRVVGKALIGSTVGAMNKGGSQFKEVYENSNVLKRNEVTKKTTTALYGYFLPAQENMEQCTDIYGKCWKEDPPKGTRNIVGEFINVGSVNYLLAEESTKKTQGDKALNAQYRAYPRTIEHAFRDEANNAVFNLTKLYSQIEHNDQYDTGSLYATGNFDWINGVEDGEVVFNPNPHGRFKVAWMPSKVDDTEHLQNQVKFVNDKYYPMNADVGRLGCDPFSLKSTHGKGSKGGIHGLTLKFPCRECPC